MEKMDKLIPPLRVSRKFYNDLSRVLEAKKLRQTDYIRVVLANSVYLDLATLRPEDGNGAIEK